MSENYQQIMDTVLEQEALLRVEHLSNEEALDLGNSLIAYAKELGISMAVSIRRPNGMILFHHLMDGTNNNNQNWMRRKYNTVNLWNHSSLFSWAHENLTGENLKMHGFDETEYIQMGGGVPVMMKTGEIVAVISVSNLPHLRDHQFAVNGLAKWLGVENVPVVAEV